jgi:hypothetical protein
VHADLSTQPTKGVLTFDMDGRTFDPGHFAGGQLHDGRLETAFISPTQVHAQQHVGPVLRLGTARAGLDIQIGVVGVHLVAEHTAKFKLFQRCAQALDFSGNVIDGGLIFFFGGHF